MLNTRYVFFTEVPSDGDELNWHIQNVHVPASLSKVMLHWVVGIGVVAIRVASAIYCCWTVSSSTVLRSFGSTSIAAVVSPASAAPPRFGDLDDMLCRAFVGLPEERAASLNGLHDKRPWLQSISPFVKAVCELPEPDSSATSVLMGPTPSQQLLVTRLY